MQLTMLGRTIAEGSTPAACMSATRPSAMCLVSV